ncbi:hypothetical protein GJ496_008632 [Pomphorhynchus laevis]|nr:hypothetical protein GJ496_003156 [Pomphorhynchus laevis]KAI0983735.1 hypothetical protein GJ496_008632 [Pomphorhynchus laevis]
MTDATSLMITEAAGLGNAISDITGIGLAHRIELFSFKLLSYLYFNETTNSNKIETILVTRDFRKAKLAGKMIGVTIGCLLGMCPLLFIE